MPALAINGYQEPAIAPAHWECLVRNDRGREEWICMGADRSQLPAVGSHYRRGADIA
jgi:hypothetical protein